MEERQRELEAKQRKSTKDKLELKNLEKEIPPLKTFLEDAAAHRKAIKAEISMLFDFVYCYVHFDLLNSFLIY